MNILEFILLCKYNLKLILKCGNKIEDHYIKEVKELNEVKGETS